MYLPQLPHAQVYIFEMVCESACVRACVCCVRAFCRKEGSHPKDRRAVLGDGADPASIEANPQLL
jgi:hypothetical protein|eukprot:SAG25_NODE_913_length_4784_cov_7.021345_2_plen_65_part_00